MKFVRLYIFLSTFFLFFACKKKDLSIEEVLTQHTWNIEEIELALDMEVEKEIETLKFFVNIIRSFDIEFSKEQELLVKWKKEIYNQYPVFWYVNQKDSTILFSVSSLKLNMKMKIEKISEERVVFRGKLPEDTTRIITEEQAVLILKAKEEEVGVEE